MLIMSIHYMYDIVTDMENPQASKASLRELSPWETSCPEEGGACGDRGRDGRVLSCNFGEIDETGDQNVIENQCNQLICCCVFSRFVVLGHWLLTLIHVLHEKVFQSLPIVDWYGCDTLPRWNGKFPSGRMMRSQCHRKAIPDTRCWLRGLTAPDGWVITMGPQNLHV